MPESATHATLVRLLIVFAQGELGALSSIAVREDSVRPLRGERPPRIGGFVPDVFANDVPTTRTFIGEAKTQADLERDHSEKQVVAFMEYLSQTSNGIFALGVPLEAAATARRLVARLAARFEVGSLRAIVLDNTSWVV